MAPDHHGFQVMLQRWPPDERPVCTGVVDVPVSRPTRLLLAADPPSVADRDALARDLEAALRAHGGRTLVCGGPGELGCWATGEPAARNILAVVGSGTPPSASLEGLAGAGLAPGFGAVRLPPPPVRPRRGLA